jgi:betaine-aldehyde dehydrogenase
VSVVVRDRLFIDGAWRHARGARTYQVDEAATGEIIGVVAGASTEDVEDAVAAARRAFPAWASTPVEERASLCERLADDLDMRLADIGTLVSREVGTPLKASTYLHATAMPMYLRQYADLARTHDWFAAAHHALLVKEPIGVVAAVTPWNYPLTLAAYKVPAALAAGCTIVLKPSEVVPLSIFEFAEAVELAGFPQGVVNVVIGGPERGAQLVSHPGVDMVSFTGSTAVGRVVGALAARSVKRVHLELGGKSPAVFLPDVDVEDAVPKYLAQAFMNNGQTCLAWSRLLVPAHRYDEIAAAVVAEVESEFAPGHPDSGARLGPMVSAQHRDRVRAHIRTATDDGLDLLTGGPDAPDDLTAGYYIRPTVFGRLPNESRLAKTEVFGPVLAIIPYADVDEAVDLANHSIFGLHGAVFGADTGVATRVATRIRAGQVDINGFAYNPMIPFGGYRQSGNGKELGRAGLDAFLEVKAIQGTAAAADGQGLSGVRPTRDGGL